MTQFKDKVVWITGAGTGIGRATARMFAGEGAKLALFGRRSDVLEEVAHEAREKGAEAVSMSLDVSNRDAVSAAAKELLTRWGRVDILVNNAGLNITERKLAVLSGEGWDQVIQVNLTGAYNMLAVVLPPMREQKDGLIVNVSSMAGVRVSGLSGTAYTASKHGMNAMSHSINLEEWSHGIRSSVLCPGEVNTDIMDRRPVPVPQEDRERMIAAEDLAEAVRFVAAMHPRTTIQEMQIMPTHKRAMKPGEVG